MWEQETAAQKMEHYEKTSDSGAVRGNEKQS
jgi:hypothetical protein